MSITLLISMDLEIIIKPMKMVHKEFSHAANDAYLYCLFLYID